MKRSYVQIDGVLYEKGTEPENIAPLVMGDIKPYQSMITGEIINSRSKHREHLREHGCQEIGNEVDKLYHAYDNIPDVSPQKRRDLLRAQVDAMSHAEFKQMLNRDLNRIRWETRDKGDSNESL